MLRFLMGTNGWAKTYTWVDGNELGFDMTTGLFFILLRYAMSCPFSLCQSHARSEYRKDLIYR